MHAGYKGGRDVKSQTAVIKEKKAIFMGTLSRAQKKNIGKILSYKSYNKERHLLKNDVMLDVL